MGKPRFCVKAKVYNLGLSVVVAAVSQHTVAATAAAATSASVTHGFGFLVEKNSSRMHPHTHTAAASAQSHFGRVAKNPYTTQKKTEKQCKPKK